jgi:hypothetical protein
MLDPANAAAKAELARIDAPLAFENPSPRHARCTYHFVYVAVCWCARIRRSMMFPWHRCLGPLRESRSGGLAADPGNVDENLTVWEREIHSRGISQGS